MYIYILPTPNRTSLIKGFFLSWHLGQGLSSDACGVFEIPRGTSALPEMGA